MKGGIESQIILPYCPYCPIIVSLPLSLEFFYFLTRDIFFSREGEKGWLVSSIINLFFMKSLYIVTKEHLELHPQTLLFVQADKDQLDFEL